MAGGALVLAVSCARRGARCARAWLCLVAVADAGAGRRDARARARGHCTGTRSGMRRRSSPGAAIVGQAEFWVASHLLSTLGADILAVFLLLAGLILVSGATLATVIRATGAGVAGTEPSAAALHRGPRRDCGPAARAHVAPATRARPARHATMTELSDSLLPPEPDTAELVVRATHVEAPPIEAEEAFARSRARARRARRARARSDLEGELRTRSTRRASRRDGGGPPRGPDSAGPLPRLGDRRPRLRLARARARVRSPARRARRPSPTPRARSRSRGRWSRRSATSGSRPR